MNEFPKILKDIIFEELSKVDSRFSLVEGTTNNDSDLYLYRNNKPANVGITISHSSVTVHYLSISYTKMSINRKHIDIHDEDIVKIIIQYLHTKWHSDWWLRIMSICGYIYE